jgi:hypothetical protein
VVVDDGDLIAASDEKVDEVRADKAGTAGDQSATPALGGAGRGGLLLGVYRWLQSRFP